MNRSSEKNAPSRLSYPLPKSPMLFTGERFTTTMTGGIEQEHRHRYLFAVRHCVGKRVLDIASGEGYGTAILSSRAAHVIGVDISEEAVEHANANYSATNLEFRCGSATAIPLEDASVDIVTSFETIEHLYEHDEFMAEIRRVLRPGGMLIMSSPNKEIYSETPENHNEFHVRELTRQEFVDLIASCFTNTRCFQQKATLNSLIMPVHSSPSAAFAAYRTIGPGEVEYQEAGLIRGVYSIIVASDDELPPDCGWGILEDEDYVGNLASIIHYNEHLLSEKDRQLAEENLRSSELSDRLDRSVSDGAALRSALVAAEAQTVALEEEFQQAREALQSRGAHLEALARENARLEAHLAQQTQTVAAIYQSTSWRVAAPVRFVGHAARAGVRMLKKSCQLGARGVRYIRERGVEEAFKALLSPGKLRAWVGQPQQMPVRRNTVRHETYMAKSSLTAGQLLAPRVVIIADMSLPQCAKYRVWQKYFHFVRLGVSAQVIEWWKRDEVQKALQTATIAIWYRVPGYAEQLQLIEEAKRLGVVTFWEVDDLIFDEASYLSNRNVKLLPPELRQAGLNGIPLYEAAIRAVDHGIASTEVLAEKMKELGLGEVFVIENCLDAETLEVAEKVRAEREMLQPTDEIVIIYGSGSKAHDADFECASKGLLTVLSENPHVVLEIVGELTLPECLKPMMGRVRRSKFTGFADYLAQLGRADISLAPLEKTLFNDAKSNIKYLEAAVLGVPSVCSAADAFIAVIEDGKTGFIAADDVAWTQALSALVASPNLRKQVGKAALQNVLNRYQWQHIADTQAATIIQSAGNREKKNLRILTANIFFAPQSFGGATIVAEEVVKHLADDPSIGNWVVCSLGEDVGPDYSLCRYATDFAECVAIKLPSIDRRSLDYYNPRMRDEFRDLLMSMRPDIVHIHSIQGLSAAIAEACADLDIPYVITLHDAWWLCERQFMVNNHGNYCFQETINLSVCKTCVPDFSYTVERKLILRRILGKADRLLAPSEFQRNLYIANGMSPERVIVNKNGVKPPQRQIERKFSEKIRFGYVGGNGPIKGLDLIVKAFSDLPHTNYELIIVDNTLNLGFSSFEASEKRFGEYARFVPAYTQDTLDEFFAGVDVLLFPSQLKESFGLTVREALLRDVWVIVTDAGGAAEDVVDGENGMLIPLTPKPDHAALREAIRSLLDAPHILRGFVNPHKDRISVCSEQAAELRKVLLDIVEQRRRAVEDDSVVLTAACES